MSLYIKPLFNQPSLPQRLQTHRTFVDAKVKWVRDPFLDTVVQKEKNLKPILALKTLILSSPTKTLPISTASSHKHHLLHLPTTTTTASFIQKYHSFFQLFELKPHSLPHIKLTQKAIKLHSEESSIHNSPPHRKDAAERLAKLLMLTGANKLPIRVIDCLKFDLGLPHNYILTLLSDFPDYFQVSSVKDSNSDSETLCLELVSRRDDLAVSLVEKNAMSENFGYRKGMRLAFPMRFSKGFELEKKVRNWVEEWQSLPYISPYEDAFHLNPSGDQAEKWTVAVLHELLSLLVSKKTEGENLFCLGEWLGFGSRFKKALVHHPGIFYVSNKIRTQTVVLREAYRKDFLVEKHPLMGMRYRYIHLMNKVKKRHKLGGVLADGRKKQVSLDAKKGEEREEDDKIRKTMS
ncbi:hypothetical protein L1049_015012 [Liquidambar formosana]|uniref:PORR domain-containing protein n=1 Tax=Liquidambar formosana TaxID=63359 RepID=A0AAP0X1L2_LIQFO